MKLSFFLDKDDLILNEIDNNYANKKSIINLCNFCWDVGKLTAISLPKDSIDNLIAKNNITIIKEQALPIINHIIFSIYNKSNNSITLYDETIEKYFIPNIPKNFTLNPYDLFIKHEFFHFLQCNGFYNLKPYKLDFLNEIAAYSFTHNFGIIH